MSNKNECGCVSNNTLFTKTVCHPMYHSLSFSALEKSFILYGPRTERDEVFWNQEPEFTGAVGRPRGAGGCKEQICQTLGPKSASSLVGMGSQTRFSNLSFKLFNVKNSCHLQNQTSLAQWLRRHREAQDNLAFHQQEARARFLEMPPGRSVLVCFSVTGER